MWKIGNIKIQNQVVLAPMAGVSNPAYMKICEELGVGYVITELISAEAIVRNNKKTLEMLNGIEKLNIPVAVQLFGSNAVTLAKAAKIITNLYKNVFIDINMGCPVPKVAISAKSGSALLKNPQLVYEIVKTVKENINVPVTVKIRSGWDSASINAVEIAKICEEAGAQAITVHPRTRAQGYTGKADCKVIKEVKNSVHIPVIGNGDIKTPIDAQRMIDETKCDAIMIGRAALGNPFLIKNTVHYLETKELLEEPTKSEKINMLKKHLNYLLENKPEKVAMLEIRTQAAYYLKGLKDATTIKQKIFQTKTKEEFLKIINEYQNS
jgi:nifR3 family TIM-barrel protein